MKRLGSWLGNGLLVAFALVVSLGLAEFAVRIAAPRATSIASQDRYGLALHYPGITRYMPLHDQTVTINSAGMRDREHSKEKPDGTFRILLLGDSFVEAKQVSAESSLPRLLEEELTRQAGRPVEVVNAGVSGWGTDDQLRYLSEYGYDYDPDLVLVVMTVHNDISDNLREYWHTAANGKLLEQRREPIPWVTYKTLQLKAFLAVHLQVVQLWRQVTHGREMETNTQDLKSHVVQLFQEPAPERIDFGWELTGLLLEQMKTSTAAHGAKLEVVLNPIENQLSDEMFSELRQVAGLAPEEMVQNRPQQILADMTRNLGIPLIDLTPAFRERTNASSEPLYVSWDGHWNEAGHSLATGVVVQGLLSGLIQPGGAQN